MITVEEWTTIRGLHAQGKSIRGIARELSLTRNTVRAALRRDGPPVYRRPKRPNPKLVPFADEIRRMLFEEHFIGTRIYRELHAQGYTGGMTALYAYLRGLKRLAPDPRLTVRFETAPGQQGQFDWSPYTVVLGGQPTKVIVYGLTLGYSRRKVYWPSLDETQASIFEAVQASFAHLGGAPKEVLVDNAKAFVTDANPRHFAWNPAFLELCGHYAVQPVACQPARPRTKGKVERPFFYLEQHFIKGHAWASFEAFHAGLRAFMAEDLDQRVHATTGEAPRERFAREQGALTPLPTHPFLSSREALRQVSWDCLISWQGSRYSVPWTAAGTQVWVRPVQGRQLVVRDQGGVELARHPLATQKGITVSEPHHYDGLRAGLPKTRVVLTDVFLARFPDHGWFLAELFAAHRPNGVAHLRAILGLAELYPTERLVAAFAAARQYRSYAHGFIRGVLEAGGPAPAPADAHRPVPPPIADLGVYQRILEAAR